MNGITEKDIKTLQSEIASLRDDLSKLTGTMGDIARREARQILKDAKGAVGDLEDQARDKLEDLTSVIERKPLASAATSFGIGFFLGLLLNNRRSS